MTQSTDQLDRLVESYLGAVAQECAGLPAGRRAELITDLREHIAIERAALDPQTEAGLRTILDRLGEPSTIAHEAFMNEPLLPGPPVATTPAPPAEPASVERRRLGLPITVAVILGLLVIVVVCGVLGTLVVSWSAPAPAGP